MRFLALVFACLALGPPLIAQDSSAGPFTLNAANQCAQASVQGRATVVMYVTGTFSITIQPEVAIQGQAASNTQVTPSTSTTAQSTITAAGNYRADVAGQDLFQLCATSFVSGSAVIYFKMTGNISTGLLGSAAAAGSVNSVSGTASQIDSTGGNNPVLSLDPNLILPSASTATTQTSGDTSASVATNAFVAAAVGGSKPPNQLTQLLSGGGVEWTGTGYVFTVGGATYLINGTQYATTLTQSVTLAAADATNDRIDWIILDTTGTATYVEGVAATPPLAPFVDPTTQLALQFVYVAALSTSPSQVTRESIYVDNTQWTGTRSPATTPPWTLASSNNPYTPASNVDIEATTAATGNFVQYVKPAAGTVDLGTDTNLIFYIRSKAAWAATRSVTIQWLNGGVARCTAIVLKDGLYNFSSSQITSYQQIAIPASSFNCSGILVTQIRFTVTGTGTTLGFYLADVLLQGFPQAAPAGTVIQVNGVTTLSTANFNGSLPALDANSYGVTLKTAASSTGNATNIRAEVTGNGNAAQFLNGAGAFASPKGLSCTELWGGTGTAFALVAGDDSIANVGCRNPTTTNGGVLRTITSISCASDNGSNTTTINPTFGAAGTGTTILSGAMTCGSSNADSTMATGCGGSACTVSNASWVTGSGIDPVMSGTLTGTHIVMQVNYTY